MTRQAAQPAPGWGARAAVCAVFAALALSSMLEPARAAQQSCPPGLFSDGDDACLKPSEHSELPLDDREPMRFEAHQLSLRVIYLQGIGTITPETPAALRAFLATLDGQMSRDLSLHSPGGDLAAGLELGEIIRQARLNTDISRSIPLERIFSVHDYDEAECVGACALAFLGGVARYAGGGARYGFPHLGAGEASADLSVATVTERSAAGREPGGSRKTDSSGGGAVTKERLAAYLDRMGIARELLDTAPAAPGESAVLPRERGKALRVIFEPSGRTVFEPRSGSSPSVTFEILTRNKDLHGWIFCFEGEPRLAIFDRSRRLFRGLEGMSRRPATFKDPKGRIVPATVSHVAAEASGMEPSLVFRIPGLTAAAFEGQGLTLEDIERQPSKPRGTRKAQDDDRARFLDGFAWADLMTDLPFTVAADNAQETLPEVLRACGAKTPARGRTSPGKQP
jgi:hypothetical protein